MNKHVELATGLSWKNGIKKLKNATDNMTIIAPFLRVLSKDNKFIFKIYFTKRPLNTGPAIAAKRDGNI